MPMGIVSFSVDNHIMTIKLREMSSSATTTNTKVSIGGAPQSNPTVVSYDGQEIRLPIASTSKAKGFVTVFVSQASGHHETATSSEQYINKEVEPEPTAPTITRAHPPQAKPSDKVTLSGQHMKLISTVYLGANSIRQVTTTDATATFQVPPNFIDGAYVISYEGPHVKKTQTRFLLKVKV